MSDIQWQSISFSDDNLRIDLPVFEDNYELNNVELFMWNNQFKRIYGLLKDELVITSMIDRPPITPPKHGETVLCKEEVINVKDLFKLCTDSEERRLIVEYDTNHKTVSMDLARRKFPLTIVRLPMLSQLVYKCGGKYYYCPVVPQGFEPTKDAPLDPMYPGFKEVTYRVVRSKRTDCSFFLYQIS
jgi:hypothetical protein